MIEKFINKYKEFADHEDIEDLDDNAKIALFSTYLRHFSPNHPSGAKQAPSKITKPNRPATIKQKDLIRKFVRQGKLDQVDFDGMTVAEASTVIDEGVNAEPVKAVEPEGEFTGSYNQASGSSVSSGNFWD